MMRRTSPRTTHSHTRFAVSSTVSWGIAVLSCSLAVPAGAQPSVGEARTVTPARTGHLQRRADTAAGAEGFLVVWEEGIGGRSRIRAARLALDAGSLDPEGIDVSAGPGGQFSPAVAWGHDTYLVVYSTMAAGDHQVVAARVSPSAGLLDATPIAVSAPDRVARDPDVAATPEGFIVVWAQAVDNGQGHHLWARRLGPDGRPLSEPFALWEPPTRSGSEDFLGRELGHPKVLDPAVAVRGSQVRVVWAGSTPSSRQRYDLGTLTFTLPSGTVTTDPVRTVLETRQRVFHPALAPFGEGYLLSWTDFRNRGAFGANEGNAALLDATGPGSRLVALGDSGRLTFSPAVAEAGLVAFVEQMSRRSPGMPQSNRHTLVLRQVTADGGSPGGDVAVAEEGVWPAMVTHPTGVTLLVYTLLADGPGYGGLMGHLVTLP